MKKLNYAIVFVADMNKAVAFYRDTLGLALKFESPHWTEFSNDGSTIALHPASAENPAGSAQLGFHVENLDAWHKRLTAADVRCLQEPRAEAYGIRQAVYRDPDGLGFTLAESLKG
jgi:catechol 2,3-dioxygenase-like lactoylglutathione lyase family enzyme